MRNPAIIPFHTSPPDQPPGGRRLLLLSYHFPPDIAAGALRWQKLAGHLADMGWGLDVVTQHPEALAAAEPNRLDDLPAGTRVYGVHEPVLLRDRLEHMLWRAYRRIRPAPAFVANGEPAPAAPPRSPAGTSRAELQRWSRVLREPSQAYHAWSSVARDGAWAARAAGVGRQLIDTAQHRAVVTCGPPHMVHEAGRRLALSVGLPLVVDMRDPWSLVQRLPEGLASPLWYRLAERFERRVLASAALVVANTEPAREAMQRLYPARAGRIITVTNGCDDEPVPRRVPPARFTVGYAGTIYLDRDPRVLFRATRLVAGELGLSPADFGIELMGTVASYGGESVEALARDEGIEGFVRLHPRGTRSEAMEFLARSPMLVSLPQDSDMAIPSKIFEYMQFDAWLLALADPASATGRLLARSAADIVRPGDLEGLVGVLRKRYQQFRAGVRPVALATEPRFGRRAQAGVLIGAIAELLESPSVQPVHAEAYG